MILYFSGTGNSRYVAARLAQALSDELVSIGPLLRQRQGWDFASQKPYVVVSPVYAWRLPRVVEGFVRQARFTGSREIYFVLTCGQDMGNAAAYIAPLCREKGLSFRGVAEIVMPENYLVLFSVPNAEESERIVRAAEPSIDAVASCIAAGKPLAHKSAGVVDRLKSGPVNRLFYRFFVSAKGFRTTDGCTGCGRCAAVCPLGNISLENGRPAWGRDCTHCMACIGVCPEKAVRYGASDKGKDSYYRK